MKIKDKQSGRFVAYLKDINCEVCGKLFHPRFANIKRCSRECFASTLKKNKNRNCIVCQKQFWAHSMKTRFCGHGCYGKWMIGRFSGSKNNFWKGGVTPVHAQIRTSSKYLDWRKIVLERDDYTCQFCGGRGVELNIDHIISFSSIMEKLKFEQGIENLYEKAMDYPLLWDINNGRTLCKPCHEKTDTYLKNYSKSKWPIA